MAALYLFSLILGGGLLLLSVLGGDSDADVDFDGSGLDLDLDAGELELDALEGEVGDAGDSAASRIFSIRTLVYALFGFGATGTVLTQMGLGLVTTLAFSVGGGLAAGLMVSLVFHYLVRTDSGDHPGDESLIGLVGTITLPVGRSSEGTVMVERGGRRFGLRALPHPATADEGDPADWRLVVVVDIDGGVARVAPLDEGEMDALGDGGD